tara:strand:+ start:940 stop:1308 length:369 start_codon:yes stop_codon:yes gene_type:complete
MRKSKIKFIKQEKGWTSKKDLKEFNKVTVTFENGDVYGFSTPKPELFTYKAGDNIKYEVTNESVKSAKALGKAEFDYKKPMSTNDSIIRQVAFKGAIELASRGVINIKDIGEFTNEFNNILK